MVYFIQYATKNIAYLVEVFFFYQGNEFSETLPDKPTPTKNC